MAEAIQAGAASIEGITANLIPISGTDIINGRYQNTELILALDESDAMLPPWASLRGNFVWHYENLL